MQELASADSANTIAFAPIPTEPSASPAGPPAHLLAGASSKQPVSEHGGSATTVIAAVGVLLLAIGVGVLIGRTGTGGSAPPSTPQVITVSAPSSSTTSTESTTTSVSSSGAGAHAKRGAKSGSSKEVGASEEHPAPPSVLKNLEKKGGGSYEQKSKNLPNVISTG